MTVIKSWLIAKIKTVCFYIKPKKTIVMCRAFYGDEWMELALTSVEPYVHKILIVTSDRTWDDTNEKPDNIVEIYRKLKKQSSKYYLLKDNWDDQIKQQNDILKHILNNHKECTHLLFLDTDEIYPAHEIKKLISYSKGLKTFQSAIRVKMYTYIKSVYYRVYPQEPYHPIALIPLRDYVHFSEVRQLDTCPKVSSVVNMHHLSFVRKDKNRIKKKFDTRGDNYERVTNWYEKFYLNFSPQIKDFHPIKGNENQWAGIEKVDSKSLPKGVEDCYLSWRE